MLLEALIEKDPDLRWRPRTVAAADRERVLEVLRQSSVVVRELMTIAPPKDLPPEHRVAFFAHQWLACAANALRDVSPIAVALLREELAANDEPGQAETRRDITMQWLRARVASAGAVH